VFVKSFLCVKLTQLNTQETLKKHTRSTQDIVRWYWDYADFKRITRIGLCLYVL